MHAVPSESHHAFRINIEISKLFTFIRLRINTTGQDPPPPTVLDAAALAFALTDDSCRRRAAAAALCTLVRLSLP
eukprot:COSAG02_NODE_50277_length_321_cov_1.157658_1_plen_74_part_01